MEQEGQMECAARARQKPRPPLLRLHTVTLSMALTCTPTAHITSGSCLLSKKRWVYRQGCCHLHVPIPSGIQCGGRTCTLTPESMSSQRRADGWGAQALKGPFAQTLHDVLWLGQ